MNCDHRIIITGTGRAGTTFLMQLLTELGFDTGYSPGEMPAKIDQHCHAGLEFDLAERMRDRTVRDWIRQPKHTLRDLLRGPPPAPYIVKSPAFCDDLADIVAGRTMVIDHVYIPMRELEAAALSRVRIGGRNGSQPGGLWKTDDPAQQKAVLAEMFFNLVHALTVHEVPHTFLLFPRLVEDWTYAYHKLWFLVKDIEAGRFHEVFARVADRGLVHNFKSGNREPDDHALTAAPAAPPPEASKRSARPARSGARWPGLRQRITEWAWEGQMQRAARMAAWSAVLFTLAGNAGDEAVSFSRTHPRVPLMAAPAVPPPSSFSAAPDRNLNSAPSQSDEATWSEAPTEAVRDAEN